MNHQNVINKAYREIIRNLVLARINHIPDLLILKILATKSTYTEFDIQEIFIK